MTSIQRQFLIDNPVSADELETELSQFIQAFNNHDQGILQWTTVRASGQISANNVSPDPSALIEAKSTTQGILFPRMTTTQKNAISSPAEGLVVYDTTLHKLSVRTASTWETITSA